MIYPEGGKLDYAAGSSELSLASPEIVSTIEAMAQKVSLDLIQNQIAGEWAGERMAGMMRFQERYQPGDCTDQLWQQLIGKQASNLQHGDYIRHLGDALWEFEIEGRKPPAAAKFLCAINNLSHDWGESNPAVGDVAFGDPKPNRDTERSTRSFLLQRLLSEACVAAGMDSSTHPYIDEAISSVVAWCDYVAFEKPDFISLQHGQGIKAEEYYQHLYRATKYMGHFSVAVRSGKLLDDSPRPIELEDDQSELAQNIMQLRSQVTHNSLPVLLEYAQVFKGVDEFLKQNEELIDEAVAQSFQLYPADTINYNDEYERPITLEELKTLWEVYKESKKGQE